MKYILFLLPITLQAPTSGKLDFFDLRKIHDAIFELRTEQDIAERQLRKINLGPSAANLLQVKTNDVNIVMRQLPDKLSNLVGEIDYIEYKLDQVNRALIEAVTAERVIEISYPCGNSLAKVDDKLYSTDSGEYLVHDYTIIETEINCKENL